MNESPHTLRRIPRTGLVWGLLWFAFWQAVLSLIGLLDPDSIDPGEEWVGLVIFLPVGLLSGILLGVLLSIRERRSARAAMSPLVVAGWGVAATAIGQSAFLGHGDQGLLENLALAAAFSVVGGLVTLVWLAVGRGWKGFGWV